MAKKRRKNRVKSLRDLDFDPDFEVGAETKRWIAVVLLFVTGVLFILSLVDAAGTLGVYVNGALTATFGITRWVIPVLIIMIGYFLFRPIQYGFRMLNAIGLVLFLLGFNGLIHTLFHQEDLTFAAKSGYGGGYVGLLLSYPAVQFTGFWASVVVLLGLTVIGFILLFERYIGVMLEKRAAALEAAEEEDEEDEGEYDEEPRGLFGRMRAKFLHRRIERLEGERGRLDDEEEDEDEEPEFSQTDMDVEEHGGEDDEEEYEDEDSEENDEEEDEESDFVHGAGKFKKIKIDLPINLLDGKTTAPKGGDLKANRVIIQRTLKNFGITAEMGDAKVGPTVTQYTLKPADGVRLSKITGLSDNLALALAAHPIRIEAPIPGKSLVGIEVPNEAKASVPLAGMLVSEEFKKRDSNMQIALGKDVMGKAWFYPLDKMPHLLIAGATGSGKSVSINTLILSLLFQNGPADLKFIMVDPKRVELPLYNGIPHLLTPVITDNKKTINALRWAIREMEKRFDVLSRAGHRNIGSYNAENPDESMPYIVLIIDELADIMAASGPEVEAAIVRLAQMSRAVGIHLVLATQRPSVDVITGVIKANIPARVAFSVASLVDSRTILDQAGAEKLLGKGDMLFMSADIGKPKRLQGAFASDAEIKRVIMHLKRQADPDYIDEVVEKPESANGFAGDAGDDNSADPLLQEAIDVIVKAKKASASLLQRRLRVGYARAARILDLLEERGVIGPADGARPREVLISDSSGATMSQPKAKPAPQVQEEDDYEEEEVDEDDGYEEGEEDSYEEDDGSEDDYEEGDEEDSEEDEDSEDDEEMEDEGDYEEEDDEEDEEEDDKRF